MDTNLSFLRRGAGLICAGAALALPGIRTAAADTPAQADAFPTFDNYIKVSGQAPFISGDSAAFATRTGSPAAGSGGIEDLSYAKDISKDSTVTINGHALGGSDDYLANLKLTTSNVGSVDAGYKSFRTFYDGVGGFFPLSDSFQTLSYEQLHVDRGSFWINATLAKPDLPVFNLSFHADTRTGEKDSTEWGPIINPNAVIVNGALVGTAAPNNTPFIAPNVLTLDEHHQALDASMVTTIGKVTETLKAGFDWVNNNDSRGYVKYPNSSVLVDPTVTVLDDQELIRSTSFRLLNQTGIKFNDRIALDVGLTYLHQSSTNGGEWITPAYSSTLKQVYTAVTAGNIYGGSKVDDFVGNVFLKLTPNKNWLVDLGFRDEFNVISSSGGFLTTSLATGATSLASSNFTVANDATYSHVTDHVATPEVSIRYLGFGKISLYGTFDDRINHGNQHWINPYAASTTAGITGVTTTTAPAPIGSVFFQEANQDNADAKIGANWNASSQLTVRAEVYRKDHQNRFVGANDIIGTASYGALYVTGYTFTGLKFSVIFKPLPTLSFNTRYQPQNGMMSVTGNSVTGGLGNEITSGKASGQTISETIDWTPYSQLYLHGDISAVYNYVQTAYPVVTVVTTSPSIPSPIVNANNNCVTGNALMGFVLNKETDAQLQVTYTRANNYNPQIASGGQPYGAGFEEESVTAGLKHKFTDRLFAEAKLGYLRRTDATTGGFTNYHGPLAYVALTYSP
jgi:hypothetical protein